MIRWGYVVVWERGHEQKKKEIHVVPCGKFGKVIKRHTVSSDCACKPVQKPEGSVPPIYVHNDKQCDEGVDA